MKKYRLKIDDSLIISRLHQKELLYTKPSMVLDSQFSPPIATTSLKPFFDAVPIHIGLEIKSVGSKIMKATVSRGYFNHGLEKNLNSSTPIDAVFSMERLNKNNVIFYQMALMLAYEELTDWPLDSIRSVRYAIALEFSRIAHHVSVLKNIFYCFTIDHLIDLIKHCEQVLHSPSKLFCRVHLVSESQIVPLHLETVDNAITEALQLIEEIISLSLDEKKMMNGFFKKAAVTLRMAGSMGLTGPYIRANRHLYDMRQNETDRIYYTSMKKIPVTDGGDAYSRFILRMLDIQSSLEWLKETVLIFEKKLLDLRAIAIDPTYCKKDVVKKMAFGEVEGPEGIIKTSIFCSDEDGSLSFHVRSPAYFIAQAIPQFLVGVDVSEAVALLHSLGICAEEIDI